MKALALALALAPALALAGDPSVVPAELQGVGVDERPGALAPPDVALTDQDGRPVRLGDYLDGKRPVLLVLAYYRCPMLCTLVLNGLSEGLRKLAWTAGDRFRVVTVSIDPRDTPEIARGKRQSYVAAYGRDPGTRGWDFLVGAEGEVERLARAVGFRYRYDERTEQYAHAAAAFVLTPDGRLARTLYGVLYPEATLRLALGEASLGRLSSVWDKVLLYCFHYDPKAGSYVASARNLMRLGGAVTLGALALLLGWLWRRPGRRAALVTT